MGYESQNTMRLRAAGGIYPPKRALIALGLFQQRSPSPGSSWTIVSHRPLFPRHSCSKRWQHRQSVELRCAETLRLGYLVVPDDLVEYVSATLGDQPTRTAHRAGSTLRFHHGGTLRTPFTADARGIRRASICSPGVRTSRSNRTAGDFRRGGKTSDCGFVVRRGRRRDGCGSCR